MGLITRMLKMVAVYWSLSGVDRYGGRVWGEPVEISCRWEDVAVEYIDPQGAKHVSQSVVFVEMDVEIGGVLMLGELSSGVNESSPLSNEGAREIKQFSKIPNLRVSEYVRRVYL